MNSSVELYVGRLVLHSCIIIRLSLAPKGHAIFNASLQSVEDALFPFCQYFVNYAFEMKLYGGILPRTCSSSNIDTVWVNWMTYLCENKWSIHLVNQKMSYSLDGKKVIMWNMLCDWVSVFTLRFFVFHCFWFLLAWIFPRPISAIVGP